MTKFEKNMEEIFDITPKVEELPIVLPKIKEVVQSNSEQDLTDAYEQSKENIQDIIDQGKDAMQNILEIAKDSQHPRAFEVYATLLKNMVDANKELLEIQKKIRSMDDKPKTGDTNIDKAIFVGSTSELSKLIKGK